MIRRPRLITITLLAACAGVLTLVTTAHAPPSPGQVNVASSPAGSSGGVGAITGATTLTPLVSPAPPHAEPELRLIRILEDFRRGQIDRALGEAEQLVSDNPTFRLAHLVYGDLLASRAGVPLSFDARGESVDSLIAEARQRWQHHRAHAGREYLPQPLVQLSESQRHALVVDLSRSRLFVFENRNGRAELLNDYYVSGGKNGAHKQVQGDRKTPVGVYFVVDRLPGDELPDKYGPVAFPVDYPNQWDQRKGRTGSGIWLHGVSSNTYSRPPLDSDGCVALANQELREIAPLLEAGSTPVIIAENVDWISARDIENRREQIGVALERWRSDWQSGEVEQYLAHYSNQFLGRGMGKSEWNAYKSRINGSKRFIRVELDDLSMFEHPHETDTIVVSFRQRYSSDSFSSEAHKRQYWRVEQDGRWRIVSEETV